MIHSTPRHVVRLAIAAAVTLSVLAPTGTASAQVRLFGTTGYGGTSSTLVELNPTTGALIATIGAVGYGVNGLDFDPTTGTLYGATRSGDPNFNGLITIDTTTGAGTPVGAAGWGIGGAAITNITVSSAGAMYGWSEWCDCLVSIDKATGVATQVGPGLGSYENGLSFDNADVLYMVNGDGAFYTIDTTTGVGTYQGTLGQTAHHGDFNPVSGLYYGLTWTYGTPRTLLACDLSVPSVVSVGEVGALHTLAFAGQLEGAAITKTDGTATEVPGTGVTYTIVAANYGPDDAPSATITDTFPAALTGVSYTATATGGATGFTASGTGNIADTVNMPSGSTVTYTVSATINPAATGTLSNTATVVSGVTDPNSSDNSATDSDTLVPTTDVSITKSVAPEIVTAGGDVVFTVVVANDGPSSAPGVTVSDVFPAGFTAVSWTCLAQGGASCTAAGTGSIDDTVSLPPGSSVTYSATATTAPDWQGGLENTATVTLPGGLTDPSSDDHAASAALAVTTPIPVLGVAGLAALVLLLTLAGAWLARRSS